MWLRQWSICLNEWMSEWVNFFEIWNKQKEYQLHVDMLGIGTALIYASYSKNHKQRLDRKYVLFFLLYTHSLNHFSKRKWGFSAFLRFFWCETQTHKHINTQTHTISVEIELYTTTIIMNNYWEWRSSSIFFIHPFDEEKLDAMKIWSLECLFLIHSLTHILSFSLRLSELVPEILKKPLSPKQCRFNLEITASDLDGNDIDDLPTIVYWFK